MTPLMELIKKKNHTKKEWADIKSRLSNRTAREIGTMVEALEPCDNKPLPEAYIPLERLYKGKKFFYYPVLLEVFEEFSIIYFEGSWVYFTTGSRKSPTFLSLNAMVDHLVKHMAKADACIAKDRDVVSDRVCNILLKVQHVFND